MTKEAIELRSRLHARDLEARCVIGGPDVEAELLTLVDAHLAHRKKMRKIEGMFKYASILPRALDFDDPWRWLLGY